MLTYFNYSPIIVKWSSLYKKFILTEQVSIVVNNVEYIIPKNFRTDFGSIPALFRCLFNPIGKEVPAYLLHDYLCSQSNKGLYKRESADLVFKQCLKYLNTSTYRIKMLYFGVRMISLLKKVKFKCFLNF